MELAMQITTQLSSASAVRAVGHPGPVGRRHGDAGVTVAHPRSVCTLAAIGNARIAVLLKQLAEADDGALGHAELVHLGALEADPGVVEGHVSFQPAYTRAPWRTEGPLPVASVWKRLVNKQALSRVVGHYESWAPGRACNKFYPKQIPRGVYTHLHFALAIINPEFLELQPGTKAEVALYSRLNTLKLADPNLKPFIAVRGWTFNDPGPTRTTFSDIAQNTEIRTR
ncbi:hypothetical protein PoMZ_07756 [Pyricularia oryzae]|uniref:GH18 domain-containing protein n=1 Tax=Pyricularia oryzae TaxID=318829 RepID=A0A4P7NG16_PYROR|nr:hypothetical protein PoMZ_07756 [Pyricularia oryzae]